MDEEEILLGSPLNDEVLDNEIDESILLEALEEEKLSDAVSPIITLKEEGSAGTSAKEEKEDTFELDYEEDDEGEERIDRFEPERPEHKVSNKSREESQPSEDGVETIFKIHIQPFHLRAGFSDGTNFGWKSTGYQGKPPSKAAENPIKANLISGLARIPGMGIPPPLLMPPNQTKTGKRPIGMTNPHTMKSTSCPSLPKEKPPSLLQMNISEPASLPGKKILINPKFAQGGGIPIPPPMLNVPPPSLDTSVPPPNFLGNKPPAVPIMGQWDAQVAAFLASSSSGKSGARRRRSRSRSESSYSSDGSYDSDQSGRSRSRSRSRSNDRRNNQGRSRGTRGNRGNWNRARGHDRRDTTKDSIESAKALGLDQDYLRKLEEQKRKREETLKRKHNTGNAKPEPPPKIAPVPIQTAEDQKNKLKAYLVVRISNLSALGGFALKKVKQLAEELGEVKKCWQEDADVVSVIFSEHDKAKNFMLKHNSKVWSGVRVAVNLEKAYLNLASA